MFLGFDVYKQRPLPPFPNMRCVTAFAWESSVIVYETEGQLNTRLMSASIAISRVLIKPSPESLTVLLESPPKREKVISMNLGVPQAKSRSMLYFPITSTTIYLLVFLTGEIIVMEILDLPLAAAAKATEKITRVTANFIVQ